MKCENDYCSNEVPEDNEDRVCAYQVDNDTPLPDYKGAITCYCCDECRQRCHNALLENQH